MQIYSIFCSLDSSLTEERERESCEITLIELLAYEEDFHCHQGYFASRTSQSNYKSILKLLQLQTQRNKRNDLS